MSKRTKKLTDLPPASLNRIHPDWTTTLELAEMFGKKHKRVLRAYHKAIRDLPQDFNRRNFAPTSYLDDQGREQPMVEMTIRGFSFLVMGFTGKKAAGWKVQFIKDFHDMEQHIVAGWPE